MDTLLRAESISRRLPGDIPVTLVEDVSLEVHAGEFLAITGPSGSGKSSLLYLLGLLDQPSTGHIWLNSTETTRCAEDRLADLRLTHLGFVFQSHFLLPEFTASENVMLPMQRLGKLGQAQIEARARDLLTDLGLHDQVCKLPKQMSGGQISASPLPGLWPTIRTSFWPMNRREIWTQNPAVSCKIFCAAWLASKEEP